MRFLALAACLSFFFTSCGHAFAEDVPRSLPGDRMLEAMALVRSLSLEEKCGQVLLVGVKGRGEADPESLALVESLQPGGIVLFGFNVPDKAAELGTTIGAYQDAVSRKQGRAALPLLMAIDHEGGSVFRFKGGVTRLPSAAEAGARGEAYVGLLGARAGLELRALGLNLALAPVVETSSGSARDFLGTRAYSREGSQADAASGAFIQGLESVGIAAAAKHFPGNSATDPHEDLPRLVAGLDELERQYYPRFASAIERGVSVILLSHILVPALDSKRPVTVSRGIVTGVLREKLGFKGLIVTDDLFMKGLARQFPPERGAIEALAAGADLLMLSSSLSATRIRDALKRAVSSGVVPIERLEEAAARVVELKLRLGLAAALDPAERAARLAALPSIVEESRSRIEASRKH